MALPEIVRVKLSTEAAGAIALTPVVVQEMTIAELAEVILSVAGKDAGRIHSVLRRGSFTSGGTWFRWASIEAARAEVETLLGQFPDPDPSRPFDLARCKGIRLRVRGMETDVARKGGRRGLFRRRSLWDVLIDIAAASAPEYVDYSYRERADRYRLTLSIAAAAELFAAGAEAEAVEFFIER